MKFKKRSPDQTATALSLSKALFDAIERARAELQMDRSNFIRYCLAKELAAMGIPVGVSGRPYARPLTARSPARARRPRSTS